MNGPQNIAETPVSEASDALQPLSSTIEFLRQHSPYSHLPNSALRQLLSGAQLTLVTAGEEVNKHAEHCPDSVFIVYQGSINVQIGRAQDSSRFQLAVGDTLYASAVYEQRPSRAKYQAERDSFLLKISASEFLACSHAHPSLQRYCQRRAGELVEQALRQQQQHAVNSLADGDDLARPLADFCERPVLACTPFLSIRQAVEQMHEAGVGSIVIHDQDRPLGIFTLQDLRRIIASNSVDLDAEIKHAMSSPLHDLDHTASSFEAVALMMGKKIRHIPICKDGRLHGLVSERDLFSLQRGSLVQLARDQVKAGSLTELAQLRSRLQTAVFHMLAHGASAAQLSELITQLNDMAIKRCIELVCRDQAWPLPVAWLSFGSEGRREQTLATDQDNGLLILGDAFSDETRLCLKVASDINQALDEIGFPLCRGNTMARNPELCLSLADWQDRFESLIATPSRQHLLEATILFDGRVTMGNPSSWQQLMQQVLQQASKNSLFLNMLAQQALEWKPALNLIGQLRGQKSDRQRVIDLKKSAIQPLVSAVRVMAIQHQVLATNTEDRLAQLEKAKHLRSDDAKAWKEAFSFLQLQRLRLNQQQLAAGMPMTNQLDLHSLNPLNKRILREALRQIERLQRRLKLDFPSP